MGVSKVEYDGNTLIDLTGDTVTAESLMKNVTAHDAAGNQITGMAVVPGINLLHNADWAYALVNQRSHNGDVLSAYCIDRWIGNGTVTPLAEQHVTLAAGTTMTQRMEIIPAALFGKSCTFSVDVDGEAESVTISFPSSASASANSVSLTSGTVELGFIAGTFTLCGVSCAAIPYVKFTATSDISIRRIFIEPGAVSHMENAAVRDYGESLTICQRYETDLSAGGGTIVGTGVSVTSRMARILCSLPATMRVKPSLEIEDISGLALRISGSSLTPSAISVFGNSSDTYVTLNVTVSEDIESNQPCALVNATGTKIRLNSRL